MFQSQKHHTSVSEIVSSHNILFYFRRTEKQFVHLSPFLVKSWVSLNVVWPRYFEERDNIFQFFAQLKVASVVGAVVDFGLKMYSHVL